MEITNRQEAIQRGQKYFYTGKPCKYGHLTKRYVGNGGCYECLHPCTRGIPELPENATGEMAVARFNAIAAHQEAERLKQQIRQRKVDRRSLLSTMIKIKIFAEAGDIRQFLESALAISRERDLRIMPEDIYVPGLLQGGKVMTIRCFPEDMELLLKTARDLSAARYSPATVAPLAQNVVKVLSTEDNEWPESDPK